MILMMLMLVILVGFGRTGSFYLPREIVKLVLSMDLYANEK